MKCPYCDYTDSVTHDPTGPVAIPAPAHGTFYLSHFDLMRPLPNEPGDTLPETSEWVHLIGCPACRKVFIGNTY